MKPAVFVGLGEGIGNIVLGLPLLDTLRAAGLDVHLDLRPTPAALRDELWSLVTLGRDDVRPPLGEGFVYHAACLTHWWLSRGGWIPTGGDLYVGAHPQCGLPEIEANLAAAPDCLAVQGSRDTTARLHVKPALAWLESRPIVGIHPGCKADPEWKRRKVYPRWAEVTHRLKELGAKVVIFGTEADDAYCGEPTCDRRGATNLVETASEIALCDAFVSGDSGLHHVAVALGVPVIALFGQSSVEKARHPSPRSAVRVLGPCETPEAFAALDPREIARVAVDLATVEAVP